MMTKDRNRTMAESFRVADFGQEWVPCCKTRRETSRGLHCALIYCRDVEDAPLVAAAPRIAASLTE